MKARFDLRLRLTPGTPSDRVELLSYSELIGPVQAEIYEADLELGGDEIQGEIALRVVQGSVYFPLDGVVWGRRWTAVEGGL